MSVETLQQTVRILQDRQAILDCIHAYCRGVDRFDRELLLSAYHADAIDDHGIFAGSPSDFADWVFAFHGAQQHATQHIVTNHSCELDGDVAHTETYWMLAAMNTSGPALSFGGGRYIDRFERRNGRWAIAARKCLIDWGGAPGESPIPHEVLALFTATGRPARDRSDPSYERPLTIAASRIGLHYPAQTGER
jgi:hypothetical protein